jgi:hypothetical protein
MFPSERHEEIISAIEQVRSSIAERLVDQMYADPFWEERYGKLGKMHAHQDVNYHLDNLVTAIRMEMLSSPVNYYDYLQNVLVHRGICTRHIHHTLSQLKALLKEVLPDEWPEIEPYLDAGYEGLAYKHPACQNLSDKEERIANAVANQLTPPEGSISSLDEWRQARYREILLHLSYLQDSVEKESAQIFDEHASWSLSFYPAQGVSKEIIQAEWRLLMNEIPSKLAPEEARPFQELLSKSLLMI